MEANFAVANLTNISHRLANRVGEVSLQDCVRSDLISLCIDNPQAIPTCSAITTSCSQSKDVSLGYVAIAISVEHCCTLATGRTILLASTLEVHVAAFYRLYKTVLAS